MGTTAVASPATVRRSATARVYYAESASNPGTVHIVVIDWSGLQLAMTCTCIAGQHGRPCRHKAAAVEADRLEPQLQPAPGGGWRLPSGAVIADRAEAERVLAGGGGR